MTVLLLTRPPESALEFARELDLSEVKILSAPMSGIEAVPLASSPALPGSPGAYAFTSANGVKFFVRAARPDFSLPVFAVGRQTAEAARRGGFSDVTFASQAGGVEAMIGTIAGRAPQGVLVYPRGEEVSADLSGILREKGFEVCEAVVYAARPVSALSPEILGLLKRGGVSGVLFFSARAGTLFAGLAASYSLEASLAATNALCLSQRVLKSLGHLPWRETYTAPGADRQGMIELVRRIYG